MVPRNHAVIDFTVAAIERDAHYGLCIAQSFVDWISNTPARLNGSRILEIGPGTSYSGAFGLLVQGAARPVYVADRWLSGWRSEYHPAFYSECARILRSREETGLARQYDYLASNGYGGLVSEIPAAAESLPVDDGCFDMIFSNAVLEHLADHQAGINEFYRVTARGGWNFHQVDYRDHRNFDLPLDHLLLSSEEWSELSEAQSEPYCLGTQFRVADHVSMFKRAGFEVFRVFPINFADEPYLASVSAEVGADIESIRILCSLIIARKP